MIVRYINVYLLLLLIIIHASVAADLTVILLLSAAASALQQIYIMQYALYAESRFMSTECSVFLSYSAK